MFFSRYRWQVFDLMLESRWQIRHMSCGKADGIVGFFRAKNDQDRRRTLRGRGTVPCSKLGALLAFQSTLFPIRKMVRGPSENSLEGAVLRWAPILRASNNGTKPGAGQAGVGTGIGRRYPIRTFPGRDFSGRHGCSCLPGCYRRAQTSQATNPTQP